MKIVTGAVVAHAFNPSSWEAKPACLQRESSRTGYKAEKKPCLEKSWNERTNECTKEIRIAIASQTLRKYGKATTSRFDWGLLPHEEHTLGIIN